MNRNLDKMHTFIKGLDVCLGELREHFPSLIEQSRNGSMKQLIQEPTVTLSRDGLLIGLSANMVAFCATPNRLEAVIIYYAIRKYVNDTFFIEEDNVDKVSEAFLEVLVDKTCRWRWWRWLLRRRDLASLYLLRFVQGENLTRTYNSLVD